MPSGYCDKTCALCAHSEVKPHQFLHPSINSTAHSVGGNERMVEKGTLSPFPLPASSNIPRHRRVNAPAPSIYPTTSPSTIPTVIHPPSLAPTRNLVMLSSGDCGVVGSCIYSPNFPNRYPSNTECNWTISTSSVVLTVEAFDLESPYDSLLITGPGSTAQTYTGMEGPDGVVVGPGEVITFKSDFGMEYGGFEICLVSASIF